MPPTRFSADVNRLRAALRRHRGSDLMQTLTEQIEQLPVAALAADNTQRYVASNAAARALTGYSQAELDGMRVTDLTPLPRTTEGRGLWEQFIAKGGQRGQYELLSKSGAPRRVRYWAFASVAPGVHISLLVPVDERGGERT